VATGTDAAGWAGARGEKWRNNLAGMEATLAPVDEPLILALRLDAPCRIADVGCGGGGTTLEIARRAPAGSVVHGFDISPALIEAARARAGREGAAVTFTQADVSTAPAPEVPHDRLLSRFGTMFYEDPAAAFANLARWLVPGGRFAFAVWSTLADNPWIRSVREVQAEVIELPASDPEAPGPFRYGDAGKLLTLLERAGFEELDARDWRGALAIGGGLPAAEAARFALSSFSVAELVAGAGDEAREAAQRSLTARYARHEHSGAVRMDACAHIVTGVTPAR
jgi:SAM-dependent methyltransferase